MQHRCNRDLCFEKFVLIKTYALIKKRSGSWNETRMINGRPKDCHNKDSAYSEHQDE